MGIISLILGIISLILGYQSRKITQKQIENKNESAFKNIKSIIYEKLYDNINNLNRYHKDASEIRFINYPIYKDEIINSFLLIKLEVNNFTDDYKRKYEVSKLLKNVDEIRSTHDNIIDLSFKLKCNNIKNENKNENKNIE